jgi:hypothetical protein
VTYQSNLNPKSKMKVIIFLLAILCSAFADHADHDATQDPCLHACRETIKTKMGADPTFSHLAPEKMTTPEGRTKMRTFIKGYISGTATVPAAVGNAETWTKLCTVATEAETCVNACPESPKREGVKKFLGVFKLGCDADFKASIPCLVEVNKVANEACQTKCTPQATKLNEFIAQREANPTERVPAPKDVLESGCKFVNCRLNCRKTDIVNKCQDKGFEQAKKLTSALASSSKMLYKRAGGDLTNWPDICKGENIIAVHEY